MIFEIKVKIFKKRCATTIIKSIIVLIAFLVLFIGFPSQKTEYVVFIGFFILLSISLFPFYKSNILLLKKIEFDGDNIILNILKYDKEIPPLVLNINETRIQIFELFFPFARYGRNFKLKFNTRDPKKKKYVTVFSQHEVGGWDLDTFKKIYEYYGQVKNVPTNTNSYSKFGLGWSSHFKSI